MRRIVGLLILTAVVSSALYGQKKGKEVTIVGEVVDTQCYVSGLTGPGRGPGHKECATNCAKGGIPLGILEEKTGTLYLAGQTKTAMTGANKMLMDFIAEKVTVKGRVFEKSGAKLLLISSVSRTEK